MAAGATAPTTGVSYAPEDPTLPKPWKGLVDGTTGYLYYWNPDTNVTQYERPTNLAPVPKLASLPISSSVHPQQSSHGQRRAYSPVKEDDRYGRGNNGVAKLDSGLRFSQVPRTGPVYSHEPLNGSVGAALPSTRGYGPSTMESRGHVPSTMESRGHVPSTMESRGHGPSTMENRGHGPSTMESRGHGPSTVESGLSVEAYLRRHEITVSGDQVPQPFMSFEETGLPSEILREVHNAGFSAPTPIQAQSWPIALQSRDIVAIAKTGSGKTLGYLIPCFMHLKRLRKDPQMGPSVLVLSPTRELATQIQDEAVKFGKSSRISCVCLYGGAPKGPQLRDLERGADIIVATPGRLNDILEMRRIKLSQISYLVLDEADRMLDMGFEPQIRKIVKEVPARRQTLMYTATWPKEVRKIAADLLVNPVQVNIGNVDELVANKSITQYIEVMAPMEKHRRLEQILRSQEPGSKIIIFCSTKKMCDQLSRNLTRQFGAAAIHGDKSQGERDYVLNQFRNGRCPVLVATDVAARGLDIKDIRVVVNYDFPTGVEDYVHRIGRTGRAGATGLAYTFFGEQDAKHASDLIKVLEGANQRVPPEIRDMASRGGGMGRPRRWGASPGGRDGGRGGRGDSGYGGRGGGGWGAPSYSSSRPDRGGGRGYDHDSRGRGRSRSRSPERVSGWSDRSKSFNRSPVRNSFHDGIIKRDRSSSRDNARSPFRERSRSPRGENGRVSYIPQKGGWDKPPRTGNTRGGFTNGPISCFPEEEEGMIHEESRMPTENNVPNGNLH